MAVLRAERRWCITGTPIQNRLTDMYSLLRFLGVDPYDQYKAFEEQILRPFKTGHDTALRKLQALIRAIVVRRPRTIVALPPVSERVESVAFSDLERSCYDRARDNVIEIINSAIDGTQPNRSTCFNAFRRINDLRYICNHGTRPKRSRMKRGTNDDGARSPFAFELDELLSGTGQMCCQCGIHFSEENDTKHNAIDATASEEHTLDVSALCVWCQHDINEDTIHLESAPGLYNCTEINRHGPSSKIQALVQQLNNIPTGDKCVVFSYWTSTLEIVQSTLTNIGIATTYFHGSLSSTKRKQILQTFTTEPSIRVILVSITCGGQGLDLTAANHAILLEPQWKPMLEEQVLSHVYRIGQEKPVHLIRFVVQHTWEEKIRTLQGRKKTLADLVVDRRCLGDGDGEKRQLFLLRELVM